MSIARMVDLAIARKFPLASPPGKQGFRLATLSVGESGVGGDNPNLQKALALLRSYIPTGVLEAFIPAWGVSVGIGSASARYVVFFIFVIGTPVLLWQQYALACKRLKKPRPVGPRSWPGWEMLMGTLAFIAFSAAFPKSVFEDIHGYTPIYAGLIILLAPFALVILSNFAKVFEKES